MPSPTNRNVFTLLPEGANALQRFFIPLVDRVLGFRDLETLYRHIPVVAPDDFPAAALDTLRVRRSIRPEDLDRIPPTGPLVVVANHPFGALEGLALLEFLLKRRKDVRVLGNRYLAAIPDLREKILAVEPYEDAESRSFNRAAMRSALHHVRSGGVLAVFPSGEVAHRLPGGKNCVDPAWSPTLAKLIRHLGAPVLPVHFQGDNSLTFHLLGAVHPRLRTLRLPRELLNKRGRKVRFTPGAPMPPSHLPASAGPAETAEYLRFRTYLLEPQGPSLPSLVPAFLRSKTPPLASAVPPALVEEEINRLGDEAVLSASGRFEVRLAEADRIPGALREIGRLREITFRACGEGTGKPLDLDRFDHHYLHLLLWDREERRIAGAYRMGLSDRILATHGIPGLYTASLFRFSLPFFQGLGPSLEMGRSFVRPEYQKSYQPLLLLWKAIARFSALNPRYRKLFGVVSISNDYRPLSKALIVRHLERRHALTGLSAFAQARQPYREDPSRLLKVAPRENWDTDVEELSRWVSQLEHDGKGVPVLIRHYLKLGARFAGFNVDPRFNHALDALMVVDLDQTDPARLERYRKTGGQAVGDTAQVGNLLDA